MAGLIIPIQAGETGEAVDDAWRYGWEKMTVEGGGGVVKCIVFLDKYSQLRQN